MSLTQFKKLKQVGKAKVYKKVFIDANIFIDINDELRENYQQSLELLNFFLQKNVAVYTSCDLITTIYYILSKKGKLHALESIEKLNKICKVIELSNKDIEKTTQLMRENENFRDLEDTLQYVLAQKVECDLIVSNDKAFYSKEIVLKNTALLSIELEI